MASSGARARLRIAFVGLPLAALLLSEDGHEVVWAGLCRRGAPGERRLRRRLGRSLCLVPDLAKRAPEVSALAPDLVVSWFWTRKIPRAFRTAARFGAIGVHPSLLPRHRGPDPYYWAIREGDLETGVTAHVLDDEYDTGDVLGQRRLVIEPSWNAWTLAKRLDRPSLALLRETVRAFAEGHPPRPLPQDPERATAAPAPSDADLELRWSAPAAEIVRQVRAASPDPGAFTDIAGASVVLTRVAATAVFPRALEPGEAFVREDGRAVVRAGDDAVELLEGRLDGDDDEPTLDAAGLAGLVGRAPVGGTSP